ncbi:hypothetical protein [Oceanicoccus sp. KOV_DT_Chl]|uniref:hypothetical protein n=1 Tax=Oceanicoccus sp. KOV_DT_Chl TaxID=1904639 RepID=UPI000C799C0C|nr:hypothetical protein [Oceanicoccus sp. KOV_DT_Chl]
MASIQFRFTTECEMTLHGATYEDIYLQFKDFMHGDNSIANRAEVVVFPPESVQVFFDLEGAGEQHEISRFKGDYRQDISAHCSTEELARMPIPMRMPTSPQLAVAAQKWEMAWFWEVEPGDSH